jgi:hypothetical protein
MAYFAEIDDTQKVIQVIAINNSDLENLPFPESEPIGQAFIASLGIAGNWLQTSFSGKYRGCYCGIGYFYDSTIGPYGEYVDPNPMPPNPPAPT